jgi:hypothetical protein
MLEGRFARDSGAPYIQAHVLFPRLRLGGALWFLIDTGADGTLLMPADSRKLRVDFCLLTNSTVSQGIGGIARGYHETAVLSFSDRRYYIYSYLIKMELATPLAHNMRLPSLLGRDILRQWRLIVDSPENEIKCVPKAWDIRSRV